MPPMPNYMGMWNKMLCEKVIFEVNIWKSRRDRETRDQIRVQLVIQRHLIGTLTGFGHSLNIHLVISM